MLSEGFSQSQRDQVDKYFHKDEKQRNRGTNTSTSTSLHSCGNRYTELFNVPRTVYQVFEREYNT